VALGQLAKKVSQSFGIQCTFKQGAGADVNEDATATHFYRIAQEAVGNAIKHGSATRVAIRLSQEGRMVRLIVEDNGKGLARAVAEKISRGSFPMGAGPHSASGGIGLQTMRYRARIIGGTFDIRQRSGGGTMVVCSVRRDVPIS
jgi:signal transduction histidine kinase